MAIILVDSLSLPINLSYRFRSWDPVHTCGVLPDTCIYIVRWQELTVFDLNRNNNTTIPTPNPSNKRLGNVAFFNLYVQLLGLSPKSKAQPFSKTCHFFPSSKPQIHVAQAEGNKDWLQLPWFPYVPRRFPWWVSNLMVDMYLCCTKCIESKYPKILWLILVDDHFSNGFRMRYFLGLEWDKQMAHNGILMAIKMRVFRSPPLFHNAKTPQDPQRSIGFASFLVRRWVWHGDTSTSTGRLL